MDLHLNETPEALLYHSKTQRARVITEGWTAANLYCPTCGAPHLIQFEASRPMADFHCEHCKQQFDIIFADPPYHKDLGGQILPYLGKMVNEGGFAAIETEREANLPDEVLSLHLKKRYNYSSTTIWLYEKTDKGRVEE